MKMMSILLSILAGNARNITSSLCLGLVNNVEVDLKLLQLLLFKDEKGWFTSMVVPLAFLAALALELLAGTRFALK